jgi:hypothetical protein
MAEARKQALLRLPQFFRNWGLSWLELALTALFLGPFVPVLTSFFSVFGLFFGVSFLSRYVWAAGSLVSRRVVLKEAGEQEGGAGSTITCYCPQLNIFFVCSSSWALRSARLSVFLVFVPCLCVACMFVG